VTRNDAFPLVRWAFIKRGLKGLRRKVAVRAPVLPVFFFVFCIEKKKGGSSPAVKKRNDESGCVFSVTVVFLLFKDNCYRRQLQVTAGLLFLPPLSIGRQPMR
jgi:hypothetical protein